MKGKINSNGFLYIYRKDFYKIQYCPYSCNQNINYEDWRPLYNCNQNIYCGDWCPLFGEPEKCKIGLKEYWKLEICCKKTLIFDELIDERGEKNED